MSASVGSTDGRAREEPGAWWFVWRLVRNQPLRYVTSLAVWVTIWTSPLLVGLVLQRFFDGLTGTPGGWSLDAVVTALAVFGTGYVVAIVTGMRLHASLMVRARSSLQRTMLSWVFGLPAARPVAESGGEVVSRFRDDTEHVQDAFDFTVDFVGSIISAAAAFVVLVAVDPVITVVVFVPIGLVVGLVWSLGARIRRYRVAARDTTEQVTGFLGETFGAAAAVKVAGAEAPLLRRFDRLNDRRRGMMVRDRTLTAATDALVNNTADVAIGIVLLLAAGSIGGPDGLSVGDVALFTMLLGRATFAAYMTGQFLARLTQADVSIDRIGALLPGARRADLVTHHRLEDAVEGPVLVAPVSGGTREEGAPLLAATGLGHRYADGAGVVDVDLEVRAGEMVAVTGRVGSGKTTLLRVLLGLLPRDSGEIRWEGRVVDDPADVLVPPRVAYTPQVPRLFSMSLRDNLALGLDVDDAEVLAAVRDATLDTDLRAMPHGLTTMIGTRGLRLSGGQVQRAAAARMLARRPRLMVFDDLSSALDVETEATLWDRLFAPGRRTAALVVSHRRPALARADEVLVLDGGRVVARGTATELLASSPLFRELWGAAPGDRT